MKMDEFQARERKRGMRDTREIGERESVREKNKQTLRERDTTEP